MKFLPKANKEAGITVLLAVLMVSGITVITVAVSFFVMQEIRLARSSALSEPAIIAAETASEQGIFEVKRGDFTTPCSNAEFTALDGGSGVSSTRIKKCLDSGPVTFNFDAANPVEFYLYDPNNININTCMEDDVVCPANGNGLGSQLFETLTFQYVKGLNRVDIVIETLDGIIYDTDFLDSIDDNPTFNIPRNIAGSNDERLKVTMTSTLGEVEVDVWTSGVYDGLPEYLSVDAQGCVGLVNITDCDQGDETYVRRINVTVPK